MIDHVAKRYGVLPSQLLKNGDSLDILCAELGQKWENEQHERANGVQSGVTPPPNLTQDEMLAMVERAKKKNANN